MSSAGKSKSPASPGAIVRRISSLPAQPVETSPASPPLLQAIGLTKRYEDGKLALDALDLEVRPGEIYCLLGANGAGKTTTLNLFLGFLRPTSGRARIRGIDVAENPREALANVAYLSENVQLYGHFSARWNLRFFTRLSGRRTLRSQDLDRALREVGLPEHSFTQKVAAFSKGMRQRLGLAIALLVDAPALLLDEPLSGLDPKAAREMTEALLELRGRGKALLLSTHDLFRARELADRVGILEQGRKVAERDREDLEHQDLEEMYFDHMGGGRSPRPARFRATGTVETSASDARLNPQGGDEP
jgi:ABC-2 type transport system ATP-binding protein